MAGKSILIIAGEMSGDMHMAHVVRQMQERDPSLTFWGVGGDELRACGMEIIHDVKEMAVMGLSEVLRKYGFFKKVFEEMCDLAEQRKPDVVLLVDYPGFNLRFAEKAHDLGLKVLYYVCPQVWAWNRSRIGKMARILDHLFVIFPFEVDVFEGTGLPVEFVGHPLVDETRIAREAETADLPWEGRSKVALLPGSRKQEVSRILLPMLQAAALLEKDNPDARFIVAAPSEAMAQFVKGIASSLSHQPERCEVVVGQTREVLRQADAAMVASGTATIESALMGCPMIVVYKTAWLTYTLGRMLVKVNHIGMVNIVAGRSLCPEYIQGAATPAALAKGVEILLTDSSAREEMKEGLLSVSKALGEGGAAVHAAESMLSALG